MSKFNAIEMLNHWILAGKADGLRPGTSDLAVIVKELEEEEVTDANGVSSVVFSLVKRIDDLEEWQRSIGRWCKTCDGKGFIVSNDSSSVIYTTCSVCKGMGRI